MPDGPDHPETWIFHLAMAWLGDPDHTLTYQERLAMIKERAKEMAEPARSAFTWIPDDVLVHRADISYWISKPWDNRGGRMTLVGDAAHPMPPCKLPLSSPKRNILKFSSGKLTPNTPDRGQGLNHCICDSSHLLDALNNIRSNTTTLCEAISAYDAEMQPRGAEEVKCSLENGLMLHDWEKVKQSPVFTNGFKPMTGHDGKGPKGEMMSDHAEAQRLREEGEKQAAASVAAH
jgi:hypothetical protein